jgi:hypothetical protein
MDEHRGIANLCYKLDELCPNYEFFYERREGVTSIVVCKCEGSRSKSDIIATIECPEHDHDYVVTKIILQFS